MKAQCGCASRTRRSISIPPIPGMFLSARTQAMPPCSRSVSASSALEAVRVRRPFSLSRREKSCSTTGSSSTTRTDEGMSAASANPRSSRRGAPSSLSGELYIYVPQGTARAPSGARCDGADVRPVLRAARAGAVAYGLQVAFAVSLGIVALAGSATVAARPRPLAFALFALAACLGIASGILLDALIRLMLVRAAAFGDGATASFAQAAGFLGRRLGACAAVQLAFLFLQLVAASLAGLLTGILWAGLDPVVF